MINTGKMALVLGLVILFYSCSPLRSVPSGDMLYTGHTLKITSNESSKYKKTLKIDLDKFVKPKANKTILGFPYKLAIYTALGTPKKSKGPRVTLRKKFGEAPTLFTSVNPDLIQSVLTAALFNKGFFNASVTFQMEERKRRKHVKYLINTGPAYRIRKYDMLHTGDTAVNAVISAASSKPLLHQKRRYNLEKIRNERDRIDLELKEKGFHFFNADYLVIEVDTIGQSHEVDLYLKLKKNIPDKARQAYLIAHSTVLMDSSYTQDSTEVLQEPIYMDHVTLRISKSFRPQAITRYVYLKDSLLYSRKDHQRTLSKLLSMGLFKYVNIQIAEIDSSHLSSTIHLVPLPKKSISIEMLAITKSNNFLGPRLDLNYMDRNLFRGGERLTVNFHGSTETQLNGQFKGLYTYEIGPKAQLSIPHLLLPFHMKPSNAFTPTTNFSSDYNFTRRVNYFDMRSLKLSLEYKWKESIAKDHIFAPISINIFSIRNLSKSFTEALQNDPRMRLRYNDQLIAGIYYSFTYNEQSITQQKNRFYFNANADLAGNTIGALSNVLGTETQDGVKTFAGIAYAQYAKFDVDIRHYYHINRKSQVVGRILAGWGIPYGNSTALPFIKSFFSGGANSIRAFTVNSLGPGTYRAPETSRKQYFLQQGGDIKLEFNLEHRFPIVSIFKGAIFADAGNTWLSKANASLPGGEFHPKEIFKELGIGAGLGIRIDLSFFVIRFDMATPIRKPWLADKNRWVVQDINFSSGSWRQENLMFNIAIGYPF